MAERAGIDWLTVEWPVAQAPLGAESVLAAAGAWLGFVALLFLGSRLLPARVEPGASGPDGSAREYRLNGLALFCLTIGAVAIAQAAGLAPLEWIARHLVALFLVANSFAVAFTLALRPWALPGGSERDPAWWGVDLKLFSYRPSLIALALANLSLASAQHAEHGTLSTPMVLYQVFTFLYVLNYFQFERGMLHTWDVIAERFGAMLVWGDYVLVPFFYSLPAWFLVHRTDSPSAGAVAGLIALYAFGFWLFRGANEQKHRFKRDPQARIWGAPARTLGGRLLVSGFWGIARHLNYTGEICMYLAFALTTGFESFLPYLLPAWLAVLLLHRAGRDDRRCREKYGGLWDEYTRRVRFRMFPLVY